LQSSSLLKSNFIKQKSNIEIFVLSVHKNMSFKIFLNAFYTKTLSFETLPGNAGILLCGFSRYSFSNFKFQNILWLKKMLHK